MIINTNDISKVVMQASERHGHVCYLPSLVYFNFHS
jgi:hypothetical protein